MQCLSCKNKNTNERCEKMSARNCLFCGVHMRSKVVRHWITFNPSVNRGIKRIQALWRGFLVRNRLKLAGKGVLKREICHNDDEVVTLATKTEVHPFDFFSIEDEGKIWWFDQRSMIQLSLTNLEVTNPYTRKKLSNEDMRRLRYLMLIRKKCGLQTVHITTELNEIQVRDQRWLRVVQIINESGYEECAHPNIFTAMSMLRMRLFLTSLIEDTKWWMMKGNMYSRRAKYYNWMKTLKINIGSYSSAITYSKDVAGVLITILNDLRAPQEFVFHILTALVNTELLAAVL
jgi:hypothetical protein